MKKFCVLLALATLSLFALAPTAHASTRRPVAKRHVLRVATRHPVYHRWHRQYRTAAKLVAVPVKVPTILEAAQRMVGTSPSYAGAGFWCWVFVEDAMAKAGYPIVADGPNGLWWAVPHVNVPQPSDLVFIDEYPAIDHGYIGHVAIVESLTAGGVNVIQGNGDDASVTFAAKGFWPYANVVGFGRQSA